MSMATASIGTLGELRPIEALDTSTYPVERKFTLPAKGEYLVTAPGEFPDEAFGRTNSGSFQVQIDPTIAEGPHNGFTIRFQRVNNTEFTPKNGNGKVSFLGMYLAAVGIRQRFAHEGELVDAVRATAGRPYYATLDWEAGKRNTPDHTVGMEKFPKNDDGTYQSWIESKTEKNPDGTPLRLLANLRIRRFRSVEANG